MNTRNPIMNTPNPPQKTASLLLSAVEEFPHPNEGYCVRCKSRKEMKGTAPSALSNGSPALRGQCATCKTTILRLISHIKFSDYKK